MYIHTKATLQPTLSAIALRVCVELFHIAIDLQPFSQELEQRRGELTNPLRTGQPYHWTDGTEMDPLPQFGIAERSVVCQQGGEFHHSLPVKTWHRHFMKLKL